MSRWAETFAALSATHDTIDTSDTRPGATQPWAPSVAIVKPVETKGQASNPPLKPAESLGIEGAGQPFVACVTSVNEEEHREAIEPPATGIGSHDTSATLATQGRDDLEERAALVEYGVDVPRRWAEGFAALSIMAAPTGFSPERWQRIVDAAGVFLDRWAAKASECGWSDLDVFGCDATAPDRRFDCMGLTMLLDHMEVVGIDKDGADLLGTGGARLRYRRRPLPAHTVSLWELTQR
jgi:hypothetical protein